MKDTFERLFTLIAPKRAQSEIQTMADEMLVAHQKSFDEFEQAFLNELILYHVAQEFDDSASLDDIIFNLRKLVIDNHIDVNMIADDMDENTIADDMLKQVASVFRKQGWQVCEFDKHPKHYDLCVIPLASKSELQSLIDKLGLYVQFF